MDPKSLNPVNNSHEGEQKIKEIRVTADQLASTFPESIKFDRTPSAIIRLQQTKTSSYSNDDHESSFFPKNFSTLEPISDDQRERNNLEKENSRIRDKINHLAKMKLRVEAPFILQDKMKSQIDELNKALINRDEYIRSMDQSYRNLQRSYNQKAQEYNTKTFYLKKKCDSKNKTIGIIAGIALLIISFNTFNIFSNKDKTYETPTSVLANNFKDVDYKASEKPKYIYTVKENDTIAVISKKIYNDPKYYKLIMKTNNLNSNKIYVGQKLLITELNPED
ncbi:MAG: hypothetical protein COA79_23505 [Planctomycetota bacterium]|nr:MAG: hypothetical protein COA79_23505 [Planctomycetota bacterium]